MNGWQRAIVCLTQLPFFLQMPSYSQLCPNSSSCDRDLGYKQVVVENAYKVSVLFGNRSGGDGLAVPFNGEGADYFIGGTIACPPSCPDSDFEAFNGGIYVSKPCSGFTNGPLCLGAAHANSCGYWTNASSGCLDCPTGGICPGGARIWTLPGEAYSIAPVMWQLSHVRCLRRLLEIKRVFGVRLGVRSS